jgi:hypothetical protein
LYIKQQKYRAANSQVNVTQKPITKLPNTFVHKTAKVEGSHQPLDKCNSKATNSMRCGKLK